jgi:4,5-dihydroxyphthalate decarboxylase
VRPIIDDRVPVDGCGIECAGMPVEHRLERTFFRAELDVVESGFGPSRTPLSRGMAPFVAAPDVPVTRPMSSGGLYSRRSWDLGLRDLRAKRIGLPGYQMSAVMWSCGVLQDGLPSTRG